MLNKGCSRATGSRTILTNVAWQMCRCHSCAAFRHPHGFSPVPHSQPMPAALWTTFNTELKTSSSPHPIENVSYLLDPTEKSHVHSSHTGPAPAFRSNPNTALPPLIPTFKPSRKLKDHTSIWAPLNPQRGTYTHT